MITSEPPKCATCGHRRAHVYEGHKCFCGCLKFALSTEAPSLDVKPKGGIKVDINIRSGIAVLECSCGQRTVLTEDLMREIRTQYLVAKDYS
jgi:hypothetical protein